MKFNEQYTVEHHVIRFLSETLGYQYVKPEVFSTFREFESEYLVVPELLSAIKKINRISDDIVAQTVIREIRKIDSNEGFLKLLRYGVNLKDPETGKMRDYFIVDYDNLENNHFVVTNQFYFEGNLENIRPDILVFINGIPVVDIEAKSPTAESADYTTAIGQLKRYEKNASKLFWPNCFNIATDGLKTVYGTTYAPDQYFLQWRDEELENKLEGELEVTLTALLEKRRLLDLIKNFIVFEKTDNGKVKQMARYQQVRATNKILDRVKEKSKKRGLVWHTQGSGKSLTMFFTAWKLRFDKSLKNPKVFVLVDRIDLDDQISATFRNCGGENVIRVTSRKDLEQKITSPERGIFISTVQKFSELGNEIENLDENVTVLSDEAHRDNEGVSAINLRNAMKKAFFFGFTGTPIDKKTLNTHRNFGEDGERYLDYYSIQQAIDDGATLPVTYEARLSKFFLDEQKIDDQFEQLTSDLSPEQKERLMKEYGKKEALVKLEKRMQAIIQDIVEHFTLYVQPNGFKAQIVCSDREATAKYKKLLDKIISPQRSAVVYSSGDPNTTVAELSVFNTDKREREHIITRFKDASDPLQFLLVCDMLLTGFDAPIEQVMYLDKPLKDHNLLQAIARTNRVYPNKGCGKIIDYYGITNNLNEALDFDESIVDSAMINLDQLKEEFIKVLNEVMEVFTGINIEDPSIQNLRRALKIFIDNEKKQEYFTEKYSRLKLLFEILSPDPFLHEYLRKFEWIISFYIAFIKEFRSQESDYQVLAEYGEKVKSLIQERIDYEGITKNFRELRIDEMYLLQKLSKMDDKEKAESLEKMLRNEIRQNIGDDPSYIKFSERLSKIKEEFEQNQIDLAERIKKYMELREDITKKDEEAKKLKLNLKEYGLYVISQEFVTSRNQESLLTFVRELSTNLVSTLDKDWQNSSKREEFIKDIKQLLQRMILKEYKDKLEVSDFYKFMNRLVDVIIRHF